MQVMQNDTNVAPRPQEGDTKPAAADAQAQNNPRSASLYVGDLNPEVNEALLFEVFNPVAQVSSIRVCRHAITRQSLGYAYINFHTVADAERVLDTMNYTEIKGRPCRLMWSQRDPAKRRSGVGNIFIKNLSPKIDSKDLHDTFSLFGNILSCKVASDREGNSKGFGFVHFESEEAAKEAIENVNGVELEGRQVVVQKYVGREERPKEQQFTNIYVKDFPLEWSEDDLRQLFSPHGAITSLYLARDKDNKSKGFAFVNFETAEGASKAIDALHNKPMKVTRTKKVKRKNEDGSIEETEETVEKEKPLYVSKAQVKSQRVRALKAKYEQDRLDRMNKWQGLNLYVRNLDESVTEDELRESFKQFGPVTSARVERDAEGRSKLFGFVCFANQEDAATAVQKMNNKLLKGKPLFVTMWQPKEVRRAQLAHQFEGRQVAGFPGAPAGYPMPAGNMQFGMAPVRGMPMGAMRGPAPGFQAGRGMPGGYGMPMYMGMPGAGGMPQGMPMRGGRGGRNVSRGGRGGRGGGRGGRQMQYRNNARNMPEEQQQQQQQPVQPQPAQMQAAQNAAADTINPEELARAPPEKQKRMIGERLYRQIQPLQGNLAGKITGMLLDGMDTAELLHLIESPEDLNARIKEALQVLQEYQKAQP